VRKMKWPNVREHREARQEDQLAAKMESSWTQKSEKRRFKASGY
jgi:hypothetical protein